MGARKKTTKRTPKAAKKRAAPVASGGSRPSAKTAPPIPGATPLAEALDEETLRRREELDAVASSLNTEGHMVMVRADEAPNPYLLRRPTGIMELDIHLAGGFAAGGMSFISGPDNAGKTWLLLQTMRMQQKLYGNRCLMVYALTEGGFPYDQAFKIGLCIRAPDELIRQWQQINVDRGLGGFSAEDIAGYKREVGDLRIIRASSGEELLTAILKVVKTKACSLVGIDSMQGMRPAIEAEKEMDDPDKMAAHANMVTRFLKKYVPLTVGLEGTNETTLIMTEQVRSNQAKALAQSHIKQWMSDYATSEAYAARHFKLLGLDLKSSSVQKKDFPGEGRKAVSKTIKWEIQKGKAGTHDNLFGEVQYSYQILPGVDFTGTVLDSAVQRGLLRKIGKQVCLVRPGTDEVMEDYAAVSYAAFRKCMEMDFEFELAVRREILASAGVQCLYR